MIAPEHYVDRSERARFGASTWANIVYPCAVCSEELRPPTTAERQGGETNDWVHYHNASALCYSADDSDVVALAVLGEPYDIEDLG